MIGKLFGAIGLLLAMTVGALAQQVGASPVLYVAPGGLNVGYCSQSFPCASVSYAANLMGRYWTLGTAPVIVVAPGTYSCPGIIDGTIAGNASVNGGANYLLIEGALGSTGQPSVIFSPATGAFCAGTNFNSGVTFEDVSIDTGTSSVGIFSQNHSTAELVNVAFTGTGTPLHAEADALIEAAATNNNIWINGNIAQFFTGGDGGGYLELDPGGTGGVITCGAAFTSLSGEFFFLDQNANVQIGNNWTTSGCGSVTGIQFIASRNAVINNCGNSNCTVPAMTIPGTNSPLDRQLHQGARYYPTTLPTASGINGIGTGGTVALQAGSGPHGGVVIITAGTGAAASGYISLSFGEGLFMANGTVPGRGCNYEQTGTGQWSATAPACQIGGGVGGGGIEMLWNNGVALTSGLTYYLDYTENGDN